METEIERLTRAIANLKASKLAGNGYRYKSDVIAALECKLTLLKRPVKQRNPVGWGRSETTYYYNNEE